MTHWPSRASENSLRLGLHWLVRVRWMALGVFVLLCVWAWNFPGIRLPLEIFVPCLVAMAAGNLLARRMRNVRRGEREAMIGLLLFGDIGLLTVMLFFAGGAHNPFTLFYFLYVVLVAILLPGWAAWVALAAAAAGFALLFASPFPLAAEGGSTCCDDMEAHLTGMVVAMTLAGAGLTYFVTRLGRSLSRAGDMLAASRAAEEDGRRFAALAALAAGVAHELATPLGTIAIASRELERTANTSGTCGTCAGCAADARLIRAEVERCREVIGRLSGKAFDRPSDEAADIRCEEVPGLLEPHLSAAYHARVNWVCGSGGVRVPAGGFLRSLAILVKNSCEASEAADGSVRVEVRCDGDGLVAVVSDTGTGIPADMLGRLGEPFFTRKPEGTGMGLGVFLVKLFCAQHGGSLEFSSGPGTGTTATLKVPRTPSPC